MYDIYIYIYIYIRGRNTYSCMYSSFVQYRPLEVQKITQPLLYFHCFFNIKFIIFFSKTYFTKSVRNFKIALLYIMKHVKILLYKVTTLNFMYDIYIYRGRYTYSCMYSSFVQYQTYSCLNLVLLRCKKSRNFFYIFIIFST
jgi:hypothetical protein